MRNRCKQCGCFIGKKEHKCPKLNSGIFTSERLKENNFCIGRVPWNKGKKRPEMNGNKYNWKGGRTKRIALIRMMEKYKRWRSEVFERDNWTCQTCGKRGIYLEAHHIKELIFIVLENKIKTIEDAKKCNDIWDVNNGVTLCKDCHNLTKYGRINYENK